MRRRGPGCGWALRSPRGAADRGAQRHRRDHEHLHARVTGREADGPRPARRETGMSRVAVKRCGQPGSADTPLRCFRRSVVVGRGGVEPPTFRFQVLADRPGPSVWWAGWKKALTDSNADSTVHRQLNGSTDATARPAAQVEACREDPARTGALPARAVLDPAGPDEHATPPHTA